MGKADHFNGLSPAEAERLALLLEEMGEAQQIIGKILRHGYHSTHPDGGPWNRSLLERELGDVLAALDLMARQSDIDPLKLDVYRKQKLDRVGRYLHHQPTLTGDNCS